MNVLNVTSSLLGIGSANECVTEYRQMLFGQYECLADTITTNSPIKQRADTIVKKPEVTKEDIYEVELAVIQMEPKEQLIRHAWALRNEFKDLVSDVRYKEYADSAPNATAPEGEVRADLMRLQQEMHWRQMLIGTVEKYRAILLRYVCLTGLGALVGLTLLASFRGVVGRHVGIDLAVLLSIIGAGVVGGLMSTVRRINETSWRSNADIDLVKVQESRLGAILSPLQGGVFALIVLFLFMGKLIEGGLFPRVDGESLTTSGLGIMEPVDFAKLLIWAFIAGFAEQFVPDNLTRLVGQAATPKKP